MSGCCQNLIFRCIGIKISWWQVVELNAIPIQSLENHVISIVFVPYWFDQYNIKWEIVSRNKNLSAEQCQKKITDSVFLFVELNFPSESWGYEFFIWLILICFFFLFCELWTQLKEFPVCLDCVMMPVALSELEREILHSSWVLWHVSDLGDGHLGIFRYLGTWTLIGFSGHFILTYAYKCIFYLL